MAIPHAKPGQPVSIGPLGSATSETQTTTIIKTDALEVLRLVLPAGKRIAPHSVPGEITVQCLEGRVEFAARGDKHELTPHQLLYLSGGDQHALHALEDSAVLVTILLNRPNQPGASAR